MSGNRDKLINPPQSAGAEKPSNISTNNRANNRQLRTVTGHRHKKKHLSKRPNPPHHAPHRPPKQPDPVAQKINAAQKHRSFNCLNFFSDNSEALPASLQSFHVVEKARRKDAIWFFKYNQPQSLMSELETVAWSVYHLIEPNSVPEKATAHFNDKGQYIGLSVKAIDNFRSTMEESLTIEDLKNKACIKGLAIGLALSIFFEEDDLHRGNMDKNGKRIDFDMSLWPLMGKFKGGSYIDWMYRPRDQERFCVTVRDIENFPDLQDAQPFYWPTKPQPIITEETRRVLSRFVPISRNAFPTVENIVFKSLKDDPTFIYYKFKTWLKCILLHDRHYLSTAKKHLRNHLTHADKHDKQKPLTDIICDHIHERKREYRNTLVQSPGFQKFLWSDGQRALREILGEFHEHNMQVIDKDIKSRDKGKDVKIESLTDGLINLEEAKNTYSEIFEAAKDCALEEMQSFTQKRL